MLLIITPILILICTPAHGSEQKLRDHDQKINTALEVVRHQLPAWVKESRKQLIHMLDETCRIPTDLGNIIVDFMGDFGYGKWFRHATIKNNAPITAGKTIHIVPLTQGRFAVSASHEYDTIKVYDADGNLQNTLSHGSEVRHFSSCSDRTGIVTSSLDGRVKMWKLTSDKKAQWCRKFAQPLSSQFLELGMHRLVIGNASTLQLWDMQNKKCLLTSEHNKSITTPLIKLSTDKIAVGCYTISLDYHQNHFNWMLMLWDTTSGSIEYLTSHHNSCINFIASLPNGLAATASYVGNKMIHVWNTHESELLHTLVPLEGYAYSLCALFDGTLASGAYNAIDIWNPTTGALIRTLRDETIQGIDTLLELSCGRLAAGGSGNNITIWDVVQGVCLQTLSGHWESDKTLKVLSDGKLLSADKAREITIWNSAINPEEFRSKK
jgi:WD40 repeat protein